MVKTKVTHPIFGEGEVLRERWSGMEVYVRFKSGVALWLRRSGLKFLTPVERLKPIPKTMPRPVKPGNFKSRKMIEAFKVGIVPYFDVEQFTFGREKELKRINDELTNLKTNKGGVLLIEGEYGSGKTHLLDYVYSWALREGYAVARVELDPFDVAPHKPKHIYREIVRSLRFVNQNKDEQGFRDILREAAKFELPKPHIFFSTAFKLIKHGEESEPFWNWIEGESLGRDYLNYCRYWKLPVLLNHMPASDVYCYLLSGLSYILQQIGAKGFIILVDEAETLFHLWFRSDQEMGLHFYKGLVSIAMNKQELTHLNREKLRRLDIGKLDEFGFIHSGVRPVPYIYEIPSNIFLILALTPSVSHYYEQVMELAPNQIMRLSKLSRADYEMMLNRMLDLYKEAFPEFELNGAVRSELFKGLIPISSRGIRFFIRSTVETLDLFRYYGR
ncbi:MAG TPA: hypothetical protein EYP60_03505 [bacterium (Candidatus Stahlbacteria)]|nr:hypothetical protein [Candidatus Stahlbacteria bacterium]